MLLSYKVVPKLYPFITYSESLCDMQNDYQNVKQKIVYRIDEGMQQNISIRIVQLHKSLANAEAISCVLSCIYIILVYTLNYLFWLIDRSLIYYKIIIKLVCIICNNETMPRISNYLYSILVQYSFKKCQNQEIIYLKL